MIWKKWDNKELDDLIKNMEDEKEGIVKVKYLLKN